VCHTQKQSFNPCARSRTVSRKQICPRRPSLFPRACGRASPGSWHSSLSRSQQQNLNNPREVWSVWDEHRKAIGHPEAKESHPVTRGKRKEFPSWLEQMEALAEQVDAANERAEQAEQEAEYFAELMQAIIGSAFLRRPMINSASRPRSRAVASRRG
jgi:hypothetical protein